MGVLNQRHILGLLLAFFLLLVGRAVRQRMLVGPDGMWRDSLWLDAVLAGPETAQAAAQPARIVLTSPLPINTCSGDSLTLLPGVGPVLAGRIAAARDSGTVFCTAEDLQRVKGIGPALSSRLDSLLIYAAPAVPDSNSRTSR